MTTEPTVEERVTALEEWRTGVVEPGLLNARNRVIAIEEFVAKLRDAWRGLIRNQRGELDGRRLNLQRQLTDEEAAALKWLVEQRRRAGR